MSKPAPDPNDPFWSRVSAAFEELLEAPEDGREQCLTRLCAGSAELERELRRLLNYADTTTQWLDHPATEPEFDFGPIRMFADGDVLAGRFRIQRYLGGGGMGEVYEAFDERLSTLVAVKTISAALTSNPSISSHFRSEVLRSRQIAHPNVCRVYDLFVHIRPEDGTEVPFFTMELLSGETLAQALERDHRFPPARALAILRQICSALDEAHARGVIHRDLKPGNVFLSSGSGGEVKAVVNDFGIAVETGGNTVIPVATAPSGQSIELTGLAGAPAYMAPEQFTGQPASIRSDIYSLGLVAYEMIAGRRAFNLTSPLAIALRKTGSGPAYEWPSGVPRRWRNAIVRATHRDPARRFASAQDFLMALTGSSRRFAARVSLLSALLLLTAAAVWRQSPALLETLKLRPPAAERIAVLPFDDTSDDPGLQYFSNGLAREIASQLTMFQKLHVVAWASSRQVGARERTPREIARLLGVRLLIMGSVERTLERVRVSVELVDADADRQLWSQVYDRDIHQLTRMVNEIRADAARQMNLGARPESAGQELRADSEAFELYLKGRYIQESRTQEALLRGLGYFELAVAKDPSFAPAYTAMAATHTLMADYGWAAAAEVEPKIQEALDRSLRLDPRAPETQAVLGLFRHVIQWDQTSAELAFVQAISAQPSSIDAHHWYGSALMRARRFDEAAREAQVIRKLDPLSIRATVFQGWVDYYRRNYSGATAAAQEALKREPSYPHGHHLLALAYAGLGRTNDALSSMNIAISLTKDRAVALRYQALVLSMLPSQVSAARAAAQELEQFSTGRQAGYLAIAFGGMGDRERMFHWIDHALEIRDSSITMVNIAPGLERYRGDARFKQAMRRVGFTE